MTKHKDGDLYKKIDIDGMVFDIRYGYYEEFERDNNDPEPIYPDFLKNPTYLKDIPLVTAMQYVCEHFPGKRSVDTTCFECGYYEEKKELIGVCNHPGRRRNNNE